MPINLDASGFTLSDFENNKCGWSGEDNAYFREWLNTPIAHQWMEQRYQELLTAVRTTKPKLPEALHGILD